jgi:hypothetical protein
MHEEVSCRSSESSIQIDSFPVFHPNSVGAQDLQLTSSCIHLIVFLWCFCKRVNSTRPSSFNLSQNKGRESKTNPRIKIYKRSDNPQSGSIHTPSVRWKAVTHTPPHHCHHNDDSCHSIDGPLMSVKTNKPWCSSRKGPVMMFEPPDTLTHLRKQRISNAMIMLTWPYLLVWQKCPD